MQDTLIFRFVFSIVKNLEDREEKGDIYKGVFYEKSSAIKICDSIIFAKKKEIPVYH